MLDVKPDQEVGGWEYGTRIKEWRREVPHTMDITLAASGGDGIKVGSQLRGEMEQTWALIIATVSAVRV